MGLVTYREGQYRFQCAACGHARAKQLSGYRFRVQNLCQSCGRYYNVPIQDPRRQTFPVLRVPCPYCGFVMPGRVEKSRAGGVVRRGRRAPEGSGPHFRL